MESILTIKDNFSAREIGIDIPFDFDYNKLSLNNG